MRYTHNVSGRILLTAVVAALLILVIVLFGMAGNTPSDHFALTDAVTASDVHTQSVPVIVTTVEEQTFGKLITFGDSHVARGVWQPAVIEHFDIQEHINLGIGSSTVAVNDGATQLPFVAEERISEIKKEDPDTVIIIGGTNDVHLETPLGTPDELSKTLNEKDKTNFYGAYSYLLETLLEWKPSLNILICTIPHGKYDTYHPVKYSDVSSAIQTIAEYYTLPVADIYNDCGIDTKNLSKYSDDGIHYNVSGNEKVSALMISILSEAFINSK